MWFDQLTGNLLDGVLTMSISTMCWVWGIIVMIYLPQDKCQRFVLNMAKFMIGISALLLLTAGVAFSLGQPPHVWNSFFGAFWPLSMMTFNYFVFKDKKFLRTWFGS